MTDDFTPLEQMAWGDLIGMYGRLMQDIEADLQTHFHISHPEFEVLLRLYWAEGNRLRIQDIAAQSILTRSGISRLVERLARAGLVQREEAQEDRRGAYATMTPTGKELFETALSAHVALVRQQFLALFSEEEQRVMGEFWRRVLQHRATPSAE